MVVSFFLGRILFRFFDKHSACRIGCCRSTLEAVAYRLMMAELADETILKMTSEREEYLKKYKKDQRGEYKDFAADALEEVLEHV